MALDKDYKYEKTIIFSDVYNFPIYEIQGQNIENLEFRPPKRGEIFADVRFNKVIATHDYSPASPYLIWGKTEPVEKKHKFKPNFGENTLKKE